MTRKHIEIVAATERDPVKAAALLIFTKHTRLAMDGQGLAVVEQHCRDQPSWMLSELDYMSKTIRSSWEFLDVTFSVRDVSRAFAQQMTRTRFTPIDGDLFGSYAMQSQRVTDMSKMGWTNPLYVRGEMDEAKLDLEEQFDSAAKAAIGRYVELVESGAKLEDARGLLPINLHCNLIAKYNLRMLVDLVQARTSYRAQGEFNLVAQEMREALVEMWPWAHLFLRPKNEMAAAAMSDLKSTLRKHLDEEKLGRDAIHDIMIHLAKLDDLIQGGKV